MFGRIAFASLPALFSLTLFVSAALLFLVELMIAKMILPLFGGTPAVWNTCMMFFQALLLAGYGYAHLSGTKAGVHRQIVIHLAILAAACVVLPVAIPRQWAPSAEGSPIGDILFLLFVSVGPPFLVLSATAPLLQQWFARTGHPSAKDPYYLYSASNLGSMLALMSYPTWVEPHLRLAEQSSLWTSGYLLIVALTVFCAMVTKKYLSVCIPQAEGNEIPQPGACTADESRLTCPVRGRWILLAFVPSSMMLGVTTFLSTDVAAIPLFWVIPLSLYLLSFIIVFARVPAIIHRAAILILPVSMTALAFVHLSDIDIPKWLIFAFHLTNFFLACMVCHGEIARTRPHPEHLTEYYLWLSVGGVLGGIFNSLVAPATFNTVLEYPLILIVCAMLVPVNNQYRIHDLRNWKTILLYLGVPLVLVPLTYWSTEKWTLPTISEPWLPDFLHVSSSTLELIVAYGLPALVCYGIVFFRKPFLFGIGIAALMLTVLVAKDVKQDIVYRERSFFGVLTVTRASDGTFMNLAHGTTLHGKQWLNPVTRFEPVSYYHRKGPVGKVFDEFSGTKKKTRIAVTGLGTGSIAAYAGPGQEIDFYEIDPAVKKISTNPDYFSFLTFCRARWRVILGDARLTMEKALPHSYDIIILDAFSSDSIPVHLLTKEAISLYFSKLNEDGILLVHISNKYVNLAPVLAALADESGYADRICDDDEEYGIAKARSTWVLLAPTETNFGTLARSDDWEKIESPKTVPAWTDDFSNILSVFRW